ncbi:hypothetical protein NW755_014205 [Fusarium falciforme]|uniref:Uncharacterized protein n=1 Tax=Fusarium falciforme TaxID=195108 RepID=A0A9W8QT42_9HYPO|nr:hypothetical protein NW755_014205 [Fusarium falciforme]
MGSLSKTNKHEYHEFIPDKDWARFDGLDFSDPYKYSEGIVNSDVFEPLWETWKENLSTPFYGVTSNGVKREGLYSLQDEGAPTQRMVDAARNVLDALSEEEKQLAILPGDSDDW